MKKNKSRLFVLALAVMLVGTMVVSVNNLSTFMAIIAARRNANAGTEVIYRQVNGGQAANSGSSQSTGGGTQSNPTGNNTQPTGGSTQNNTTGGGSQSTPTQDNGGTEADKPNENNNSGTESGGATTDAAKAVDMYVKALNNAKANAKTVTLVKDGALNYNEIFEAGAFSSFAPMLKAFFKLDELNAPSDKSDLPPRGINTNLDAKNVKEASVKEDGGNYIVEITLNDSTNPVTNDGGVGSVVNIITQDQITGGVEGIPGITLSNIKLDYTMVKITATIDKATGNLTYLIADAPSILYLDAKALMLSINSASVGIECISEFKLEY